MDGTRSPVARAGRRTVRAERQLVQRPPTSLNFAGHQGHRLFTDEPGHGGRGLLPPRLPAGRPRAYWLARQLGLAPPGAVTTAVAVLGAAGSPDLVRPPVARVLLDGPAGRLAGPPGPAGAGPVAAACGPACQQPGDASGPAGHPDRRIALAVGLSDVYYVAFTLLSRSPSCHGSSRTRHGYPRCRARDRAALVAGDRPAVGISLFVATRGRAATRSRARFRPNGSSGRPSLRRQAHRLVLPWSEHRVPALQFLSFAYGVAPRPSVEQPALGVVALVGVVAILWLALHLVGPRAQDPRVCGCLLAALTLVSLAFYTRGRARVPRRPVRHSPDPHLVPSRPAHRAVRAARRRPVAHPPRPPPRSACCRLAAGICSDRRARPDQPRSRTRLRRPRAQQRDLTAFTRAIAGSTGPGCSVFQLPVRRLPGGAAARADGGLRPPPPEQRLPRRTALELRRDPRDGPRRLAARPAHRRPGAPARGPRRRRFLRGRDRRRRVCRPRPIPAPRPSRCWAHPSPARNGTTSRHTACAPSPRRHGTARAARRCCAPSSRAWAAPSSTPRTPLRSSGPARSRFSPQQHGGRAPSTSP